MASFGSGMAGGLGAGMAFGAVLRDAMDERELKKAMGAKLEESEVETAPSAPVESENQDAYFEQLTRSESPDGVAPSMEPAAPKKSRVWAIGEGENRKEWTSQPSDEDIRQWRYDTILKNAGSKHADKFMTTELQRDATKRAAEKDSIALRQAKQAEGDMNELRAVSGQNEGSANLADVVRAAGGTEAYIAQQEAGMDAPFSAEQRQAITQAAGLAQDPTSRYRTMMQQAAILRRSNPAGAMDMEKAATKQAAGQFIAALQAEDSGAVKSLYNIFPNGHLVSSVRFKGDQVVATDTKGQQTAIPKRELMVMAQAYAEPDKAMNTLASDERLALQQHNAEIREKQLQTHNQFLRDQLEAKKNGLIGGKGKGGAAGGVTADDIDKMSSLLVVGKNDAGVNQYGMKINGQVGEVSLPDVVRTANDILENNNGANPEKAKIDAVEYHATLNVREKLRAAIDAAGNDTALVKKLEKQLAALPQITYRARDDGRLEEVLATGGVNPSYKTIRTINPASNYDVTKDPDMAARLIEKFNDKKAPEWRDLGLAVLGDGTAPVPAEEQGARLKDYAGRYAQAAVEDAARQGKSPDYLRLTEKAAIEKVQAMSRYLPIYQEALATQAKAAAEKARREERERQASAMGVSGGLGTAVQLNNGDQSRLLRSMR